MEGFPLTCWRRGPVGRSFPDSLRGLEGTEVGEVIEVCAHVASDTAATIEFARVGAHDERIHAGDHRSPCFSSNRS